MKNSALKQKVALRIKRSKKTVLLRSDFTDLGGYDQVGRSLKQLVGERKLVRIGKGLYTRARPSVVTGEPTIDVPGGFKAASRAALERLGYEWEPAFAEQRYNSNESTQIAASAEVVVKGRFNRKIEYGKQCLQYQVQYG
jgi:hypothetical protein